MPNSISIDVYTEIHYFFMSHDRPREIFFNEIRRPIFGGRLSSPQVKNIEIILDTWERLYPDADPRWIANSLAQIHHETGGRMEPVRETFASSDEVAKSRLERAWKTGRLPWVRAPYWRTGYFGRGHIQLTHERNYLRVGERIGVDLVGNPALMLDSKISAEVAVIGMVDGLFTRKSLGDYFNETTDDPPNARRIINGPDGTDAKVARLHHQFLSALAAAL